MECYLVFFILLAKFCIFFPNDIYTTTQLLRLWEKQWLNLMSGLSSMWKVLSYSILYAFKTILNIDAVCSFQANCSSLKVGLLMDQVCNRNVMQFLHIQIFYTCENFAVSDKSLDYFCIVKTVICQNLPVTFLFINSQNPQEW